MLPDTSTAATSVSSLAGSEVFSPTPPTARTKQVIAVRAKSAGDSSDAIDRKAIEDQDDSEAEQQPRALDSDSERAWMCQ